MKMCKVNISTQEGNARSYVFKPSESENDGPWPAVIMFMDGLAIRPALFEMASKLASEGFYVLLPDMFWRNQYDEMDPAEMLGNEENMKKLMNLVSSSSSPDKTLRDTGAFISWLRQQPQVSKGPLGVTGYCIGGGMALRAAAAYPADIGATASFHGGDLYTDSAESPHRFVSHIKGPVLVAGAENDQYFDHVQFEGLNSAFSNAGINARVEIWEGAKHGWVPRDSPVHNPAATARHWNELNALLKGSLS